MGNKLFLAVSAGALLLATGCETTSSRPYTPSTENVVALKSAISTDNKVKVGKFVQSPEVSGDMLCRAMGAIEVVPGKTPVEAIESALRDELFLAEAYSPDSDNEITAEVNELSFSSFGTGVWEIGMLVKSTQLPEGYQVNTDYSFRTSYSAVRACQNVVDAFVPAVQQLNKAVITHPSFNDLVGG